MNKEIKSIKQQGGITAETVNVRDFDQSTNVTSKKGRPWYLYITLTVIATIIAGIILKMIYG